MAWPNKEIDYQTEFGVASKEELQARLKKVNDLEATNATLQTKLTEQESNLNTVKATLATIEERVNQQPVVNNNNNNNNNTTVDIPSVVDDENAAFATRMAPLYKQNMETTALVIEDQVLRRLATSDPRFPKMEKEIRDLIAKTPLQFRANTSRDANGKQYAEQVIENAYYVVKGRYADTMIQDSMAGKGDFFVEPARNGGNTGSNAVPPDPTILTDEDRRVIAKMGVSEKTYQEILKNGGPNMGGALSNKTSF